MHTLYIRPHMSTPSHPNPIRILKNINIKCLHMIKQIQSNKTGSSWKGKCYGENLYLSLISFNACSLWDTRELMALEKECSKPIRFAAAGECTREWYMVANISFSQPSSSCLLLTWWINGLSKPPFRKYEWKRYLHNSFHYLYHVDIINKYIKQNYT